MANYKRWNDTELAFIRDNISLLSDTELANKLSIVTGQNISYGMIRRQRRKLGIQKKRGRRRKDVSVTNTTKSIDENS